MDYETLDRITAYFPDGRFAGIILLFLLGAWLLIDIGTALIHRVAPKRKDRVAGRAVTILLLWNVIWTYNGNYEYGRRMPPFMLGLLVTVMLYLLAMLISSAMRDRSPYSMLAYGASFSASIVLLMEVSVAFRQSDLGPIVFIAGWLFAAFYLMSLAVTTVARAVRWRNKGLAPPSA